MRLGKTLGRIGFVIGFLGHFLFYACPFSWLSFESGFVCPWCAIVDTAFANWLTWVNLGLTVGLMSGLLLALVGFSAGYLVTAVRGKKAIVTSN